MPRFTARLEKDEFFGERIQSLPRDLVLVPQTWSASDRGGCKQATLEAIGSAESLASLCGWLGNKVEIFNEFGECLWWGDLWDIELSLGNIVVNLSLDEVHNRIKVTYPNILADGSEESKTTEWAEDANSVTRYGSRELIYGATRGGDGIAEYMRDTLLKRMSLPSPVVATSENSEYRATLTAQGTWYKADSVYFQNTDGLEEHTNENGSQVLSRYLISNQISFGEWNPDNESLEAEEMTIGGGRTFATLKVDDSFTISGAVAVDDEGRTNNDSYIVRKLDHPYQIGVSGRFTPEAAGPTIKVSYGDGIAADGIAMRFSLASAWTMTRVAVIMRKLGEPTDLLRVEINSDAAGQPGTLLSAADFSAGSLFTDLVWTEFALPPIALASNTSYWLYIHRMGAASLVDGYEIVVDEDLGYVKGETPGSPVGDVRVTLGGGWVQRTPPCDMPFRIIGEIQSTAQLLKAFNAVDSYWRAVVQFNSGILVRQYEVGTRSAMDEINELLEIGTSSGDRIVAWVTRDRAAIVDLAPLASSEDFVIGVDGRLRYPNGSNVMPGKLIYGQTVGIDSILLLDGLGIRKERGAAVYISESSYSASNDRLTVRGEGAPDTWSALKIVKG